MYRAAGNDALALDTAATTLLAARRAQLMGVVNDVALRDIDRYTTATTDLRSARHDLDRARTAERKQLSDLAAQRQVLDARLAAVQQAYRAEVAARHAAAVLAAEAASAARHTTTSGRSTATDAPSSRAPSPGPAPTPAPPPPQPGTYLHHNDPFLSCVRQRESGGYYGAVSPSGYYGAYQFSPSTWNVTASHVGRIALVGVRPDRASPWDQDDMAWTLYQWQGASPWGGHCP